MLVQFRPEAEADVGRAYLWYEDKRVGLGEEFLGSLGRAIAQIVHILTVVPSSTGQRVEYCSTASHIPYGVFYVSHTDEIHVIACFHASLDPQHWRDRL